MQWEAWLLFFATAALAGLMPGPAVLYVVVQGMQHGGRKSAWAAAGVLSANAVYFALSATSLAALILASYNLFVAIRWLGAAYLIYMGLRCLFARATPATPPDAVAMNVATSAATNDALTGSAPRASGAKGAAAGSADAWRIWLNGALLQAANPKALIFFNALLPQFIDAARPVPAQVFIMGATSISVEFCILLAYGCLAARAGAAFNRERYGTAINRAAGALLIAAGLLMAAGPGIPLLFRS